MDPIGALVIASGKFFEQTTDEPRLWPTMRSTPNRASVIRRKGQIGLDIGALRYQRALNIREHANGRKQRSRIVF